MAKLKSLHTRYSAWPDVKAYMQYVERLAKQYNAVDGDFQDTRSIQALSGHKTFQHTALFIQT